MLNFFLNQNTLETSANTLSANPIELYFDQYGGSSYVFITITPNIIPIFFETESWITYIYNSTLKRLTITTSENLFRDARTGFVDIFHPHDESINVRIFIEQLGL